MFCGAPPFMGFLQGDTIVPPLFNTSAAFGPNGNVSSALEGNFFFAPISGMYSIAFSCIAVAANFYGAPTSRLQALITLNKATYATFNVAVSALNFGNFSSSFSCLVPLNAGDALSLRFFNADATNAVTLLSKDSGIPCSWLSVQWIAHQ